MGRKPVVIGCLLGTVISHIMVARSTTLAGVAWGRVVGGVTGGLTPIAQAAVADVVGHVNVCAIYACAFYVHNLPVSAECRACELRMRKTGCQKFGTRCLEFHTGGEFHGGINTASAVFWYSPLYRQGARGLHCFGSRVIGGCGMPTALNSVSLSLSHASGTLGAVFFWLLCVVSFRGILSPGALVPPPQLICAAYSPPPRCILIPHPARSPRRTR